MKYYPVKYGKIMHIPTHIPYSDTHIKIFESGNKLSYRDYYKGKASDIWHTLTIKNGSVYLYLLRRRTKDDGNYNIIPCLQINILDTYNFHRYISGACRDGFRKLNNEDPMFFKKGKGVYNSITKLTYEKINEHIRLPKVSCITKYSLPDVIALGAYPILRSACEIFKKIPINTPPVFSSVLRRAKTIKELTKLIYGKKYDYGANEIVNALRTDNWGIVTIGYILKNILPIEYIKEITDNKVEIPLYVYRQKYEYDKYRKFFKIFHPKKLRSLLLSSEKGNGYILSDMAYMYNSFSHLVPLPAGINKIGELHDYYSKEISKLRHADFPLNYSKRILELDNINLENLKIIVPKTNHQLIDWGKKMSNCIGSYGERATERERVLLGIFKENELVYNIEIYGKRINQFYAKYNQHPEETDYEIVKKYLEENNFIQKEFERDPIRGTI